MPHNIRMLLQGWRIQARTIRAITLRTVFVRYGRNNIGFVWTIIEPMILCLGVMFVWSLMGAQKHGVTVAEVVFTGYMPLTLWRHMTNGGVRLFTSSRDLLFHRRITLFDILFGRIVLEFIGTSAALLAVWIVLNSFGVIQDIARLDLLLLGWLMMAFAAMAFCAVLATLTEYSETSERFVQPMQYLNIPLSGCFFFVDWLPPWAQTLILYHPLVHCYEAFRAGYFGDAITTYFSFPYFAACAFVMSFVGILGVHKARGLIE